MLITEVYMYTVGCSSHLVHLLSYSAVDHVAHNNDEFGLFGGGGLTFVITLVLEFNHQTTNVCSASCYDH